VAVVEGAVVALIVPDLIAPPRASLGPNAECDAQRRVGSGDNAQAVHVGDLLGRTLDTRVLHPAPVSRVADPAAAVPVVAHARAVPDDRVGGVATRSVGIVELGGEWATRADQHLPVLGVGLDEPVPPDAPTEGASRPSDVPTIGVHWDGSLIVVLSIHQRCQHDLLVVRLAARLARFLARAGEDREEDRRQDGNDGDHNQQLNERETTVLHLAPPLVVGFRLLGGYKIAVKE